MRYRLKKLLVALGIAALSTGAMAQNVGSSIFYNSDNGHYYQRITNSNLFTWDEANTAATNMGGYLATLTSEGENTFVVSNAFSGFSAYNNTYGQLLLGATDRETEGVWKWVTGETWSFTNWHSSDSNNVGAANQDYLVLAHTSHFFNAGFQNDWDDEYGDGRSFGGGIVAKAFGFMVEWNSNPTNPTNNAVPEPSEWAAMGLLGAGLLGLVFRGRKKNLAN
jgi:hypothetical protein